MIPTLILSSMRRNRQLRKVPPSKRSSRGGCLRYTLFGGCLVVLVALLVGSYEDVVSSASVSVLLHQQQQQQDDKLVPSTGKSLQIAPEREDKEPNVKVVQSEDSQESSIREEDANCPFKDSLIYHKVYVYPNHGDVENGWSGDILSEYAATAPRWPFLDMEIAARSNGTGHYDISSQNVQYTTELLIREIIINPQSCLRTYDPEEATLFYVPYLPSIEHHRGETGFRNIDYSTSPYGQAIMDIVDKGDYTGWETHFGLTSKYWKRRGGSDHILVFSEPMHGLYHPRSRRGNFHFIRTQKQLKPPIVVSVELSTTFVKQYPKCAAKNILVPYPNTDGNWFNGNYAARAQEQLSQTTLSDDVALSADPAQRPVAQFYSAGAHGTCTKLRKAMTADYRQCSRSFKALSKDLKATNYATGMQLSTFCPCPGGDSPSAKRHFDSLFAQCIPVILSYDFVWPFTHEFDPDNIKLDPAVFSLRLQAQDYEVQLLNHTTCQPLDESRKGLQSYLESISQDEIERLRKGVQQARELYAWYEYKDTLVENPLRDGILPTGGAAHQVVQMLGERAGGARWPECEEELKEDRGPDATSFKC